MPEHRYAAILAAKTPAERVAIRDSMHRNARRLLADRVAELVPNAPPEEQRREYLLRLLGRGTVADLEARG